MVVFVVIFVVLLFVLVVVVRAKPMYLTIDQLLENACRDIDEAVKHGVTSDICYQQGILTGLLRAKLQTKGATEDGKKTEQVRDMEHKEIDL